MVVGTTVLLLFLYLKLLYAQVCRSTIYRLYTSSYAQSYFTGLPYSMYITIYTGLL